MRWPWQAPIVEHRSSSLTDQVVVALLASASGGGARPALATAALETCATLYASALSACAVRGPSSVTRAFDSTWRASVAAALIRTGQCVYVIGADPVAGLALEPVGHWDVMGGPLASSWVYRVELAGPTGQRPTFAMAGRPRAAMGGCESVTTRGRYRQFKRLVRKATLRRGKRARWIVFADRKI